MAVAFRSQTFAGGGAVGTSITGVEPTGTVANDFILGLYLVGAGSAALSIPGGWTSIFTGASSTPTFRYALGYVLRGGSAPSYAFTHTGTFYRELFLFSFSGVDNGTPLDVAAVDGGNVINASGVPGGPNPPAITPASADTMIVGGGSDWNGSATGTPWVAGANYTMRSDNTIGNDGVVATRLLAGGAGVSEDPGGFTGRGFGSSSNAWSFTLALRPAGAAVILPDILVVPNMAVIRSSFY